MHDEKNSGNLSKIDGFFCLLLKSRLLRPLSLPKVEELDITVAAITPWLSLASGRNELGSMLTKIVVKHAQSETKLPHST